MQINTLENIYDSNYHFLINKLTCLFYLQKCFLTKCLQIEKSCNLLLTVIIINCIKTRSIFLIFYLLDVQQIQ